jgi:uncharacterized protein YneF (UPF0154 family)
MRKLLQHMIQATAQRASRNKIWHMMQTQKEVPPDYLADDGPLTSEQIEQIKQSVRTKYA